MRCYDECYFYTDLFFLKELFKIAFDFARGMWFKTIMEKRINIGIPEPLHKRLQRLRGRNDLSVAANARRAIKEYLARQEALEKKVDGVLR